MALSFQTFVNPDTAAGGRAPAGGQSLFKAMGHPLAAERAPALRRRLAAAGRLGVYDPDNQAACFDQLYDLAGLRPAAVFVRALEALGTERFGRACEPASGLATHDLDLLLVAGFDTDRLLAELGPFLPAGLAVAGLAELRLPADMLTRRDDYLAPLNFATNFALLRDADDRLLLIRQHGSHFAGRLLGENASARIENGTLIVDSGEQRYGAVRLAIADPEAWRDAIARL